MTSLGERLSGQEIARTYGWMLLCMLVMYMVAMSLYLIMQTDQQALQAFILTIIGIKPEDLFDIRQRSLFVLISPTSEGSIDQGSLVPL